MYARGKDDFRFILFYTVVLTLGRFVTNEVVLEALAKVGGVKPDKVGRFKDQGWQCLYYIIAWVTGFCI